MDIFISDCFEYKGRLFSIVVNCGEGQSGSAYIVSITASADVKYSGIQDEESRHIPLLVKPGAKVADVYTDEVKGIIAQAMKDLVAELHKRVTREEAIHDKECAQIEEAYTIFREAIKDD